MLLCISNLGRISHRFPDTASANYSFKHSKLRPNRCKWEHGYYWQFI